MKNKNVRASCTDSTSTIVITSQGIGRITRYKSWVGSPLVESDMECLLSVHKASLMHEGGLVLGLGAMKRNS